MIVKFLMPLNNRSAMDLRERFERDGIAPLSFQGCHHGFVRQVSEEGDKLVIIADVTDPSFISWIKEKVGEGPIEIEVDDI